MKQLVRTTSNAVLPGGSPPLSSHRLVFMALALVALIGCEKKAKQAVEPGSGQGADERARSPEGGEVIEKAREFYESRPHYERPRDHSPTPKNLANTDAETCGACHRAIYEEWKISTHHRAYEDDAQFMAELAKSRGQVEGASGDVGWLCVNCHTPTYPQLERLVIGLEEDGAIQKPIDVENPLFDPDIQQDAITCAACHVQDGVVLGPYGDPSSKAPHPVRKSEELLDERICASCHQASAQYPVQNLGCFFDTVEQWQASPYPEKGQPCQHCHMPVVERKVAEAFDVPVRKTRRHWFGGSLIPKKPAFAAELEPLEKIYGSGVTFRLEVSDEKARTAPDPEIPNMVEGSFPELLYCESDCMVLTASIRNDRAGHHMPTGDPERHIEVLVEVVNASGDLVARSYQSLGSRYEWWPTIKLLRDTRLPAGETLKLPVSLPASGAVGDTKGEGAWPMTVRLTADKWRMYEAAFEHHALEGRYVRGRRFYVASWQLSRDGSLTLLELIDDGAREVNTGGVVE